MFFSGSCSGHWVRNWQGLPQAGELISATQMVFWGSWGVWGLGASYLETMSGAGTSAGEVLSSDPSGEMAQGLSILVGWGQGPTISPAP